MYQEREAEYLNKVGYLEKENQSLAYMIEEKDKKIHEISKKSKEDKVRIYQFLTEIEAYKEANAELMKNRERDRDETVRLSEMSDSLKRSEKTY